MFKVIPACPWIRDSYKFYSTKELSKNCPTMYFLRFLTRRNYIQRHSLRVYTSTPRCQHVLESNMNGGAAILDKAILALPLPLNLLLWLSAWLGNTSKTERNRMFQG